MSETATETHEAFRLEAIHQYSRIDYADVAGNDLAMVFKRFK